jgi:ABC-type Fe3+ transport system permease subunit
MGDTMTPPRFSLLFLLLAVAGVALAIGLVFYHEKAAETINNAMLWVCLIVIAVSVVASAVRRTSKRD